jgi:hypothetical protein
MSRSISSIVILFLFGIFFYSCSSSDKETQELPEEKFSLSAFEEGDILSVEEMPASIMEWIRFYQAQDTGFRVDRFRASGVTLHMGPLSLANQNSEVVDFTRFFSFSPDKNRYIDLVSYSFQLNNGKLIPGEADQQVVLADVAMQKRYQLLFYGPGQMAEASGWFSNDKYIIAGISRTEDGQSFSAELLLFDLRDSLYTNFQLDHLVGPDTTRMAKNGFMEYYYHDLKK